MPTSLTILQPIAADTPLASLFNNWLAALAPVEKLTSPKRPDSFTRTTLLDLTVRLHGLHQSVVRAIRLLENGAPLAKLSPCFTGDNFKKAAIGLFLREKKLLFAYAAKGSTLTNAAVLSRLKHAHTKTYQQMYQPPTDFTPVRLEVEAVLALSREADTEYYFLEPEDETGRERLVMLLRAILGVKSPVIQAVAS